MQKEYLLPTTVKPTPALLEKRRKDTGKKEGESKVGKKGKREMRRREKKAQEENTGKARKKVKQTLTFKTPCTAILPSWPSNTVYG